MYDIFAKLQSEMFEVGIWSKGWQTFSHHPRTHNTVEEVVRIMYGKVNVLYTWMYTNVFEAVSDLF